MNTPYSSSNLAWITRIQSVFVVALLATLALVSFFLIAHEVHAYERSHLAGDPSTLSDWYTSCIAIHLDEQGSSRIDQEEFERVAYASLEVWEDQKCTNLSLEVQGWSTRRYVGYNIENMEANENLILFQSEDGDWLYDGQVVGLTTLTMCQNETEGCQAGTIIDGDIELNEVYFELTSTDDRVEVDLQNVLTHEVGHLIGFDHTPDLESTMYAATPIGETSKRDLTLDDQQGVCDVYPTESTRDQFRLGCLEGAYVFGEESQRGNGDADGDGIPDYEDDDNDNDGVIDEDDVFPFDPDEIADSDGDGVGDNSDAFPNDPNESGDVDGDGIGDNTDDDADGDGVLNQDDLFPLDPDETVDSDGDGVGDNGDAFPSNPDESVDTDGDGVGNNEDLDDDGDEVADEEDAFPLDPTETLDSDGDGVGDNADLFPFDPNLSTELDEEGLNSILGCQSSSSDPHGTLWGFLFLILGIIRLFFQNKVSLESVDN